MCKEKEIAKRAFAKIIEAMVDLKSDHCWDEDEQKIVDSIDIPDAVMVNNSIYKFEKVGFV